MDHTVALAEAWDSGISNGDLEAFGDDSAKLNLMTGNLNQSKGDQDIAEWTPPHAPSTCHYVNTYVSVKVKYGLSVDQVEKEALLDLAGQCGSTGGGSDNGGGVGRTWTAATSSGASRRRRCSNVKDDVHRLDRDGDGQACESLLSKPASGGGGGTQGGDDVDPAPEPEPVENDLAVTG